MKKHLQYVWIIVFILAVYQTGGAFESAGKKWYISSTYSGHEEITRQALNNISKKIKDFDSSNTIFEIADLNFDLQPEKKGLFGYKARNMVIHGNFATDFPQQTKVFNLAEFWDNPKIDEFENASSQSLHFLRNYLDSVTLDSAYSTCMSAREIIKKITLEALKRWDANDKARALFLVGHALHTIQDSFSPAHTQRTDDNQNNDIKQICFFGSNMRKNFDLTNKTIKKQLCYHSTPDSDDAIWNLSRKQYKKVLENWKNETAIECDKSDNYPTTDSEKISCLKNEARLARVASEKYLFLVFNQFNSTFYFAPDHETFIASLDSRLFEGPVGVAELDQKMTNGIMRCDSLSQDRIVGEVSNDEHYNGSIEIRELEPLTR